jgi:hypothetical protein
MERDRGRIGTIVGGVDHSANRRQDRKPQKEVAGDVLALGDFGVASDDHLQVAGSLADRGARARSVPRVDTNLRDRGRRRARAPATTSARCGAA